MHRVAKLCHGQQQVIGSHGSSQGGCTGRRTRIGTNGSLACAHNHPVIRRPHLLIGRCVKKEFDAELFGYAVVDFPGTICTSRGLALGNLFPLTPCGVLRDDNTRVLRDDITQSRQIVEASVSRVSTWIQLSCPCVTFFGLSLLSRFWRFVEVQARR